MKPLFIALMICLSASAFGQVTQSVDTCQFAQFERGAYPIPDNDTNCYIICQKLDTLAFEKVVETREVDCPSNYPGCLVLHWGTFVVWKPVTVVKELVRIKIPCDKARLIDTRYLKVEKH